MGADELSSMWDTIRQQGSIIADLQSSISKATGMAPVKPQDHSQSIEAQLEQHGQRLTELELSPCGQEDVVMRLQEERDDRIAAEDANAAECRALRQQVEVQDRKIQEMCLRMDRLDSRQGADDCPLNVQMDRVLDRLKEVEGRLSEWQGSGNVRLQELERKVSTGDASVLEVEKASQELHQQIADSSRTDQRERLEEITQALSAQESSIQGILDDVRNSKEGLQWDIRNLTEKIEHVKTTSGSEMETVLQLESTVFETTQEFEAFEARLEAEETARGQVELKADNLEGAFQALQLGVATQAQRIIGLQQDSKVTKEMLEKVKHKLNAHNGSIENLLTKFEAFSSHQHQEIEGLKDMVREESKMFQGLEARVREETSQRKEVESKLASLLDASKARELQVAIDLLGYRLSDVERATLKQQGENVAGEYRKADLEQVIKKVTSQETCIEDMAANMQTGNVETRERIKDLDTKINECALASTAVAASLRELESAAFEKLRELEGKIEEAVDSRIECAAGNATVPDYQSVPEVAAERKVPNIEELESSLRQAIGGLDIKIDMERNLRTEMELQLTALQNASSMPELRTTMASQSDRITALEREAAESAQRHDAIANGVHRMQDLEQKFQNIKEAVAELGRSGTDMNQDIANMMEILTSSFSELEKSVASKDDAVTKVDAAVTELRVQVSRLDARASRDRAIAEQLQLVIDSQPNQRRVDYDAPHAIRPISDNGCEQRKERDHGTTQTCVAEAEMFDYFPASHIDHGNREDKFSAINCVAGDGFAPPDYDLEAGIPSEGLQTVADRAPAQTSDIFADQERFSGHAALLADDATPLEMETFEICIVGGEGDESGIHDPGIGGGTNLDWNVDGRRALPPIEEGEEASDSESEYSNAGSASDKSAASLASPKSDKDSDASISDFSDGMGFEELRPDPVSSCDSSTISAVDAEYGLEKEDECVRLSADSATLAEAFKVVEALSSETGEIPSVALLSCMPRTPLQ
ncbi:unnamed protein product [Ostreobium quekettii]|uniref:Uncharacterized protein n=1 Tax=Ostreobium quekettii TaxID=121088 RepID=A0A8S1J3P7_9CHLO|nr:unnamed protein product [Ostreobium quekettii]